MAKKMTPQQYEQAARAVHEALSTRRQAGGRRLHADNYKRHAAKALGIRSVYAGRWAEVLDAASRLGLFKLDRNTLSFPILVLQEPSRVQPPEPSQEPAQALPEARDHVHLVEDTSDEPTVEAEPARVLGLLVKYKPGHRDAHRGVHLYMDAWMTEAEIAQWEALARRSAPPGAVEITMIRKAAPCYKVTNGATQEAM